MKLDRFEFTVAPKWKLAPFPIDMLRYDECFPATERDAAKIYHSINSDHDGSSITVACYCGRGWRPTSRRWESFSWQIVPGGAR